MMQNNFQDPVKAEQSSCPQSSAAHVQTVQGGSSSSGEDHHHRFDPSSLPVIQHTGT